MTGVQWIGSHVLPGSVDVINRLQELNKTVYFVTNSPHKSRLQLKQIAQHHKFHVTEDQILSASYAASKYLSDRNFTKKVYLIGEHGISDELKNHGIRYICSNPEKYQYNALINIISNGLELDDEVGAVLIGFDQHFNYWKILEASNYLKDSNCLFLGTSMDVVLPTQNGTIIPVMAPLIRAIETSCNRVAKIIGKPNSFICESLLREGKIVPERTLFIGDSVKSDIVLGKNCGFQTMLVGSGVNSLEEVLEWKKSDDKEYKKFIPDVYLPKLGDLLPFLM